MSTGQARNHWESEDVKRAILPHVESLAKEWGLILTGKSRKGWLECHAFDREDSNPSAAINADNGSYKDLAGGGKAISIFDLAVQLGAFSDFPSAVDELGERFNVEPRPLRGIGGNKGRMDHRKTQDASDASDASIKTPGKTGLPRSAANPDASKRPAGCFEGRKGHPSFAKALESATRSKGLKKIGAKMQAHWSYLNADGSESFRVVRFRTTDAKGKTYRPFHNHRGAGWYMLDPEGPLPLYGLPDLATPGRKVVLEGEKGADLAKGLGLIATTSAHGAKATKDTDWSPLAGQKVVVLPDAGKAGDEYAASVIEILAKLDPRPSVRILRLPGLAEGEDLEQWIERVPDGWDDVQTREELERLIDGAIDPTAPELPADEHLGLACIDGVEIKPVEWIWQDRIPRGKITLLAGEGEIGKTFLTLDLIARFTTGRPHPDRQGEPTKPFDCIFITAEDGLGDTIKPRLVAMGADCKRVFTIGTAKLPNGKLSPFTIADIERLELIMAKQPGIRLIVIDPIAAFLGRVDENKNAELRGLLGPLSDFADRYNVAIVCITHFGKNPSTKATARILGSVAYSNAARTTWCVVADPDDDDRRLMLRVKNNLSANKSGMAYRIAGGVVEWEADPIHLRTSDVLSSGNGGADKAEAKREKLGAFLRDLLANGPLPSDEVKEKARAAGFGKDAIWKAKDEFKIRAKKNGMTGGWVWEWTGPIPEASEASEASEGYEPSEASQDFEGFSPTISMRPVPRDFKPTKCARCNRPLGAKNYRTVWDGDSPVAECFDCMRNLGA